MTRVEGKGAHFGSSSNDINSLGYNRSEPVVTKTAWLLTCVHKFLHNILFNHYRVHLLRLFTDETLYI